MKISEIVYFLMKLVKYLFLILLGLTIAIYLYAFFIPRLPGEPVENISERNKRALDAVLMSYGLLIYIVIIPSFRGFSLTRGIRKYVGE